MFGTAREAYIDILTELIKEEAPVLYLEDFLYYYNKGISEYLKARYELFETNQQLSDDVRVWKRNHNSLELEVLISDIGKETKEYYRHLLNCIVEVELNRPDKRCEQKVFTTKKYKAVRMSSSMKAGILDNVYLEPEFYRPYFDIVGDRIKIYIGYIDAVKVKISTIGIEYLKQPEKVDLTEEQVKSEDEIDTSQVLEFPRDVGEEIIKVVLRLILERGSHPRLQTHVAVNQSISDASTGLRGGQ